MVPNAPRQLTLQEVRERLKTHWLRQAEIPVEHVVSLPLPTRRWGRPAYAFFASPAVRLPGQPLEQGAPDRWACLEAQGGQILVYARSAIVPFAGEREWPTVTVPPVSGSLAALKARLASIESLAEALIPAFFAGESGAPDARQALLQELTGHIAAPLLPQHEALAPDFFSWLRA